MKNVIKEALFCELMLLDDHQLTEWKIATGVSKNKSRINLFFLIHSWTSEKCQTLFNQLKHKPMNPRLGDMILQTRETIDRLNQEKEQLEGHLKELESQVQRPKDLNDQEKRQLVIFIFKCFAKGFSIRKTMAATLEQMAIKTFREYVHRLQKQARELDLVKN